MSVSSCRVGSEANKVICILFCVVKEAVYVKLATSQNPLRNYRVQNDDVVLKNGCQWWWWYDMSHVGGRVGSSAALPVDRAVVRLLERRAMDLAARASRRTAEEKEAELQLRRDAHAGLLGKRRHSCSRRGMIIDNYNCIPR